MRPSAPIARLRRTLAVVGTAIGMKSWILSILLLRLRLGIIASVDLGWCGGLKLIKIQLILGVKIIWGSVTGAGTLLGGHVRGEVGKTLLDLVKKHLLIGPELCIRRVVIWSLWG